MKKLIIIFIALTTLIHFHAFGQKVPNYEISINGKTYDIILDHEYQIKSDSGNTLYIRVNKKAVMTYQNKYLSFQHKSDLSVSSTNLGNGIRQTMTTTAVGTLILIQQHTTMNPIALVDLMLQEFTKEQINYGYKMQKQTHSKTLADGTKLTGKRAILKYDNDEVYWTVLACGKENRGFMVITQIDKENLDTEKNILELMWETLQFEL
jgi:hypothetical protein